MSSISLRTYHIFWNRTTTSTASELLIKCVRTVQRSSLTQVRSDQVQTGLNASRPSAEKDGILYLPSNGLDVYRDTGAAWGAWGPLWKLTPPVDGDFSWVNQGTASVAAANGYVALSGPDAGGDNLRMRVKSAPSTPFTITIGCLPCCAGGSFEYSAGFCLRQSSDGKVIVYGISYIPTASNGYFIKQHYTNATTFSANSIFRAGAPQSMVRGVLWLQYHDDGTNRSWRVSGDGITFLEALAEARTTHLTADQVGFFVNPYDCNAANTVIHWAES